MLEMFVKLIFFRLEYFCDLKKIALDDSDVGDRLWRRTCRSLQAWNILDFFCVVAFLVDKLASPLNIVNPQMFRLLRLFRLFRLVRLLRFLEQLDHLYVMTTAISGVGKVLGWATVLLTTVLLMCNLCLVQILQATYFDKAIAGDLTDVQLAKHHEMYSYFGTCTRSCCQCLRSHWGIGLQLLGCLPKKFQS